MRSRPIATSATVLVTLLIPTLFACGRGGERDALDAQLRADLQAAAMAPSLRTQVIGPAELGYPSGYGPQPYGAAFSPGYPPPYPPTYPPAYPHGYAPGYPPSPNPSPYPARAGYPTPVAVPQPTRVVYGPQAVPARASSSSASSGGAGAVEVAGSGGTGASVPAEENNTQRGAIIGAATGAAIGIATSRDKVKGGAVGAVTGAVLGGVVGSQVYTRRRPRP